MPYARAAIVVDVVALPFAWQPHELIGRSALAWRLLDLAAVNDMPIDQVICTKFPSYAIQHPRKVVWLVHQHRQAYDWYGTPFSDFARLRPRIARGAICCCVWTAQPWARRSGSTRSRAMSARGSSASTASTANRSTRPSRYDGQLRAGPYGDYILSDARLDAAKRLDLLAPGPGTHHNAAALRAHQHRAAARAAGAAGWRAEASASGSSFAATVPDAELIELYAGARAVYYAPFDEDYGFTTVQALAAARPVLTTDDAGGVLEFVEDGANGFVVAPQPEAIAARLDTLAGDGALAARLGSAGPARVAEITWERVIDALVL